MDGVDPGSTNPIERLKYVVYQRRLFTEALKTKAMLYAMLGEAEKASNAAKEYFDTAFPVSKDVAAKIKITQEERLKELENMGPVRMRNGKLLPPSAGFPSAAQSP